MSTASPPPTGRSPRSYRVIFVSIFAVVVLVPSLIGFGNKLREFYLLSTGDQEGRFALSPLTNYLLASVGFFFVMCWAVTRGMFRDVEGPKIAMLETEARLDAEDHSFDAQPNSSDDPHSSRR